MKDKDENNFYLVSKIVLKKSDNNFNEKNSQQQKYTIFSDLDDYFLIINNVHNKFTILKNQSSLQKGDEIIFYTRNMSNHIELMKFFDKGIKCQNDSQLKNAIQNLDNNLWKIMPKEENSKYFYELKINDIFRFGGNKFILREINFSVENDSKNKEKKKKKKDGGEHNKNGDVLAPDEKYFENPIFTKTRQFSMQYEHFFDKKCDICTQNNSENKNYTDSECPIIKICQCEKYYHINCLKEKMKNMKNMIIEKNNNEWIKYEIKTRCPTCKKYIPPNFIVKKGNVCKYFELIDIRRNILQNYLIFETIDFLKINDEYIKYLYYIEYDIKNMTNIYIMKGPEENDHIIFVKYNDNAYDEEKKIYEEIKEKIKLNKDIAFASIIYNNTNKSFVLNNSEDNENTLILKDKYIINPDDNLIFKSNIIKMESYLIKNSKIEKIKKDMEKNPSKIEENHESAEI